MPAVVVSWLGRGAVGRAQELLALSHPSGQAEQGQELWQVLGCRCCLAETRKWRGFPCTPWGWVPAALPSPWGHGDCPAVTCCRRLVLSQHVPFGSRACRGSQGWDPGFLAGSTLSLHPLHPTEHSALEKPQLPFHLPIPPVKVCFLSVFLSSFPPSR